MYPNPVSTPVAARAALWRFASFVAVLAAFVFATFVGFSQAPASGSLEGRVFNETSGNYLANARWKRLSGMFKWNYRGKQRRDPIAAVAGYEYIIPRLTLDASVDYQLGRTLTLYANAQNLTNEAETAYRYGPETPDYAKHHRATKHGVQITVGVRGSF